MEKRMCIHMSNIMNDQAGMWARVTDLGWTLSLDPFFTLCLSLFCFIFGCPQVSSKIKKKKLKKWALPFD